MLLYGLLNQKLAYSHYTLKSISIECVGQHDDGVFETLDPNEFHERLEKFTVDLLDNQINRELSGLFNIQLVMNWTNTLIMKFDHLLYVV